MARRGKDIGKKLGGEKREERRKNGMGKVEIYCEKKKWKNKLKQKEKS